MIRTLTVAGLVSFTVLGCATNFTGDPHFPDGPHGCAARCSKDGMTMASFVYVGEYSDACVCAPKGASAAAQSDAAGAMPAAASVMMQTRRAEEQQRAATRY